MICIAVKYIFLQQLFFACMPLISSSLQTTSSLAPILLLTLGAPVAYTSKPCGNNGMHHAWPRNSCTKACADPLPNTRCGHDPPPNKYRLGIPGGLAAARFRKSSPSASRNQRMA
jgi:hypothetical protein